MKRYRFYSGILASLLWGSWSFFVNDASLLSQKVCYGLIQGCTSFIMTMLMIDIIDWLLRHSKNQFFAILFPALFGLNISALLLLFFHYFTGTTNIFKIILPSLLVSFLFSLHASTRVYQKHLVKEHG